MSRLLWPAPLSGSRDLVTLKFRFQVGATGGAEPDAIVPASCGVTDVIRNATTGQYEITFDQKFPVFIGMVGTVLEAEESHDLIVKCGAGDYSASTGVLTVQVVGLDGSTADEDVIEDDWVYLEVTFCRNSVGAPTGAI
jgi:hypothetical protein